MVRSHIKPIEILQIISMDEICSSLIHVSIEPLQLEMRQQRSSLRQPQPPSYYSSNPQAYETLYPNGPSPVIFPCNSISSASSLCPNSQNLDLNTLASSIQTLALDPCEENLPIYSAGADVQPVTVHNSIPTLSKIVISNPKPYYDIGDIIHGKIIFAPRKVVDVDTIYIVLEGEESTTKSSWTNNVYTKRHFKLAHHIVPPSALPADMKALSGYRYSFPFTLQIPDLLQSGACEQGIDEHFRLPPSLGSPKELLTPEDNLPQNVARIVYNLRSCVKILDSTGTATQNYCHALSMVRLLPSYSLSPNSLQRVKMNHGYARQSVKKGMLKKSCKGIMELKLFNVPELPIVSFTSTALPLLLSFVPSIDNPSVPPPQVSLISVKLNARTLYSTGKSFLTSPPAEDLETTALVNQKFSVFRLTPETTRWEFDVAKAATENGKPAYSTLFHLPLCLPQDNLIVPTFESCLVARDYTIEVTVYLSDNYMLTLSTPVNVVASLAPKSNIPFGDFSKDRQPGNSSLAYFSNFMGLSNASTAPYSHGMANSFDLAYYGQPSYSNDGINRRVRHGEKACYS